jgi:hypothetical protein
MIHDVILQLDSLVSTVRTLLYVDVVQPLLFRLGFIEAKNEHKSARPVLFWFYFKPLSISSVEVPTVRISVA